MSGAAAAQATTSQTPAGSTDLDSLVRTRMADVGLMGLGAMVLVDGTVEWSRSFGHRDAARTQPFTLDTPVGIASITKTITGVAMMQLVAEGKLDLDGDVQQYVPFPVRNPRAPDVAITLRMLATHTSSITDRPEVYRDTYHFGAEAPEPLGDFLAAYLEPEGRLHHETNYGQQAPGRARDYSNIGAALAGHVVERVSGERLDHYTTRRIFEPLRMVDSGWFLRDLDPSKLSSAFIAHHGMPVPIQHYGTTTYPDGGVRTSVNDLSRFLRALLARGVLDGVRILPESQADEMLRFQFGGTSWPEGYGAGIGNSGLFWRTKWNGERMGHGGNDPGVQAEMMVSLDRRVAVIVLCNTSASGADARAFADIFDAAWKLGESRRR
jgi:CubicO group peptidase (beta-lactamase class C family)